MAANTSPGLGAAARGLARRALGGVSPRLLQRVQQARARRRYAGEPHRGPRRVLLEATTACNYRCLMCTDHGPLAGREVPAKVMPWGHIEPLLRELASLGGEEVWLAGRGEPLCHPQVGEMVALTASLGMKSMITTNGGLLTDTLADELCDAGVYQLSFSLNSGSPETYAAVHGAAAGERARLLALMRRISQRPQPPLLLASLVLLQQNSGELLPFVRDAIAAGVVGIEVLGLRFADLFPTLALESWDRVRADLAEAQAFAQQAGVVLQTSNVPAAKGEEAPPGPSHWTLGCFVGHLFTRIDVDGVLHGCCSCENLLASLHEGSFAQAWWSRPYQKFREAGRRMAERGAAPPACNCADCGNGMDNAVAFREQGFRTLPPRGR